MIRKRKMKSVTFYFVAAVFLACYLAETAECYRRRKPLRIDVRKETESTEHVDVHEGEILFGKSLKGPESQPMDGTNRPSSNASVEDETGYQADFPGFPYDHTHTDAWNHMTKSLQCGADQMHLKVAGSGVQHFAVNQLNGPSLPLPLVPTSCGYNMRRLPYFLHLSIPYRGCNIIQRGGYYMLPLKWRGIPIVLSCMKPPYYVPPYPWHPSMGDATTSQTTPAPAPPAAWPVDPWVAGQQSSVKHWDYWNVNPPAAPAPTTVAPPLDPQLPGPFPFPHPWWHHHHYQPPYHHHHPPYYYPHHHHPPYYYPHHHHHPYWLHSQVSNPDSPPMTTMMPYGPLNYPPFGNVQIKAFPDPSKS